MGELCEEREDFGGGVEHVQRVCAVWEQFGREEDGRFAVLLYRFQELCAGVYA